MTRRYKVLIMGGSYGSLFGIKLALAGHDVKLVCLPSEVDLFNRHGAIIRMPVKGIPGLVEINSTTLPGKVSAAGPADVDPSSYDLIGLAMQEPQFSSPGARELLNEVATSKVPCISIMNMPPPPYLRRLPDVNVDACGDSYTEPAIWENFDPRLMTLCSPDPQAFRPPGESLNVLQVRLPTNFKVARFDSNEHTEMLRRLQADIEAIRFNTGGSLVELPVKLKVHDSKFVPLAKWSMLLAGNYRCIREDNAIAIKDAVHADLAASRSLYEWVARVCIAIGARPTDLVPFEKYAQAALLLTTPSSAARALFNGARNIERVDRLVKEIAAQKGLQCRAIDEICALVDARLQANRHSIGSAG